MGFVHSIIRSTRSAAACFVLVVLGQEELFCVLFSLMYHVAAQLKGQSEAAAVVLTVPR